MNNFSCDLNIAGTNDAINNPAYNRKLAELMARIGDDSTTMANLYDGTIIAVKMKTVICTYVWNEKKGDFVPQRTRNVRNNRRNKQSEFAEEYGANSDVDTADSTNI